ncbi:MAG: hypothetical protein JWR90_1544 [Marmoricola sp.]|nr:hypothetical protein [Marmoricola sp.]
MPGAAPGATHRPRWVRGRGVDLATSLVLAVALLGPMLLRRGYVLRGDMVFVPAQPWKGAWLGLDGRVPRFVPGDAFLSSAGMVLPGDLVQKLVLLVALAVGGVGAGRLTAPSSAPSRVAGIALFLWNPWVYERLAIGQWGVVVGYLLLPWTVLAAERRRDGHAGAWSALALLLGVSAVFSPASGLVALATAVAVVAVGGGRRAVGATVGLGLLMNLTWIVPSLVHAGALAAPDGQFAGFAPRAESGLGVVASLLSFGGIWKASIVPPERTSAVIVLLSCLLTLAAVAGLRAAVRTHRSRVLGLAAVGGAALLLTLVTAVPGVVAGLDAAAARVPALGILRDSQRYLGPAVLALVPCLAAATDRLHARARQGVGALHVVAGLLVVAPVLCLPTLAFGMHGDLHPVAYPREWFTVRDQVPGGRMVVLPWRGGYRGFDWNDRRASLDPAPRFFPGDVLIDDRLYLGSRTLDSEDPLLLDVRRALLSTDPVGALHRLGVRTVLVEKGTTFDLPDLSSATVLHDGPELTLVDLGKVTAAVPRSGSGSDRTVILLADLLVLLVAAAAGVRVVRRTR